LPAVVGRGEELTVHTSCFVRAIDNQNPEKQWFETIIYRNEWQQDHFLIIAEIVLLRIIYYWIEIMI
jgi:hypothetical protein